MPDEIQKLLDAERAVTEVLGELEQLRTATREQLSARTAIENVQVGVRALVDRIADFSDRAKIAVGRLGELGMPEVLERIGKLRADVEEGLLILKTQFSTLSASLRTQQETLGTVLQDRLESEASRLSTVIDRSLVNVRESVEKEVGLIRGETRTQSNALRIEVQEHVTSLLNEGLAQQNAALNSIVIKIATNSQESQDQIGRLIGDALTNALESQKRIVETALVRSASEYRELVREAVDPLREELDTIQSTFETDRRASRIRFAVLVAIGIGATAMSAIAVFKSG